MKRKKMYTISIVIFLIDQIVKLFIINNMKVYEKITIIRNFFDIYYVRNEGAAFSTLWGERIIFIMIGIIVLISIHTYIEKKNNIKLLEQVILGLLTGGILGNLFDRIIHGYVIDFLSFTVFGYSFAVFNVADVAIVVSCLIMIIECFRGEKDGKKF